MKKAIVVIMILSGSLLVTCSAVAQGPLYVPGNAYAFQYTTDGLPSGATPFGMYFSATNTAYELTNGAGTAVFSVGALTGNAFVTGGLGVGTTSLAPGVDFTVRNGIADFGDVGGFARFDNDGDLVFNNSADYLVGPNRYAFRFSLDEQFGLLFSAANTAYEFLDGVDDGSGKGSPVFSIGASNGNVNITGTAKIETVAQNNALTEILVKDATGLVHYRDASTLGGGGGGFWAATGNDISSTNSGKVGIGTTTPQTLLAVNGTITCKEVDVTWTGFPDYVFGTNYRLMPLLELSDYIKVNGHLPNIPSEAEVLENGLGLGALNLKMMEKIEELTLHAIEQQKIIDDLAAKVETLMNR